MSDPIEELTQRMVAAAQAEDFETATRLRDQINLIRGGATLEEAQAAETAGLLRQRPGAMGLGTSQQRMTPPPGWTPPARPDPMTASRNRGRKK